MYEIKNVIYQNFFFLAYYKKIYYINKDTFTKINFTKNYHNYNILLW